MLKTNPSRLNGLLATLFVAAIAAALFASSPAQTEEKGYLPGIDDKAQDAFREGLASALRPLPKCNQYRLLEDGSCCQPGFVSQGRSCARIAPLACAAVAIDNPGACRLTMCAKYIREVEIQKKDAKGEPVAVKDEKGIAIPGQFETERKEEACPAWKNGVRDLSCLLDTYECTTQELASGPTRWCGDWMKSLGVPRPPEPVKPTAEDGIEPDLAAWQTQMTAWNTEIASMDCSGGGDTCGKIVRCTAGDSGCELVVRECTGNELVSGRSDGAGPCKIGEFVDTSSGKCTAYTCPKHCTTHDGRCEKCGPDYEGASKWFKKAVDADKQFYEAYFNLGMALERLGRYDDARDVYKQAHDVKPESEQERSLQLSAQAFLARGKLGEAKRVEEAGEKAKAKQIREQARGICEAIRGQDPDNTIANNTLALYWVDNGNFDLAEKFVRQVLRVNRADTIALNIRGLVNLKKGEYEIARWILEEKVLALDPANPEALANLGLAYVHLGDLPKAVLAFERAVKLKPNSVNARMNLGAIYVEYLNYKEAARQYEAALKLEPDNLEALTGYALALEGRREPKKAAELYERVIAKDPSRHAIIVRLALIYDKVPFSDTKKSIAYWERYQKAVRLPSPELVKAERDASKTALEAHMKKRTPRKGKAEFMAERAALEEAAKKADLTYKNVLAISSRIDALKAGIKLNEEMRKEDAKKPAAEPTS